MEIVFKEDKTKEIESIDSTFDNSWIKTTFLLSDAELSGNESYKVWIRKNRYRSSADYKVTCTAPGMNLSCNPKPQFTRYADIRSKGKINDRPNITLEEPIGNTKFGLGMGRYYSEAFDDNYQRIYLRFGVPKYQPLIAWIKNSFDIKRAAINNRGFISTTLLNIVDIVTTVFAIAAAPVLALSIGVIGLFSTSTKFYSLQPTMHLYWLTVENILNSLAARRTLLPNILSDFAYKVDNRIGQEKSVNTGMINELHRLLGDVIDSKGRISVFAIALKSQRAFNVYMHAASKDIIDNFNNPNKDFLDYPLNKDLNESHDTLFTNKEGDASFFTKQIFKRAADILTPIKENQPGSTPDLMSLDSVYKDSQGNTIDLNLDPNDPNDTIENRIQKNIDSNQSFWTRYKEAALAEITDGSAFAIFNVESTGSVGESFSNSTKTNPLESMFNGVSDKVSGIVQTAKQAAGTVPFLDEVASFLGDSAAVLTSNATFGLANPLLALAYGLHVTMPKIWESSSSNLPSASYKLRLISPYGNAFSQLFNIYLPLSMILAGGLPRSTGNNSHTSPFLCQLYDRGRVQISLGMIDSINITRGTSNLAFSRKGQTNAIDVEFTIANLDEVLSIDTFSGGIFDDIGNTLMSALKTESSPMEDYISTIAGLDVYNQVYLLPKMRLKLSEAAYKLNKYVDPDPAFAATFTIGQVNGVMSSIFGNNAAAVLQPR